MKSTIGKWAVLGALAASGAIAQPAPAPILSAADYDRAARFLLQNRNTYVLNSAITPHWVGADRFWYRSQLGPDRSVFLVVDAETGAKRPAFDHAAVAQALGAALGKSIEPEKLPFKAFRYGPKGEVEVIVDGKLWSCRVAEAVCAPSAVETRALAQVPSPDGKWLAFLKNNDLWIRPAAGGEAFPLTSDGAPGYAWGVQPGGNFVTMTLRLAGVPDTPSVLWSPDSKRILTHRIDDRGVGEIGLLQSVPLDGSVRPKLYTWRMPAPNDAQTSTSEPWVFDLATRTGRKIEVPASPFGIFTPIERHEVWWSKDSAQIGVLSRDRYSKSLKLFAVDPATGAAKVRVAETGKTFVEAAQSGHRPMVVMLDNGEVLWFSERDGAGKLYLYDTQGAVKQVLPVGVGAVSSIVRLDQAKGLVWVRANGREADLDPYLSNLYRVDLKTGHALRVTPEDADHDVGLRDSEITPQPAEPITPLGTTSAFSPDGRFFVDTYSTVATPPVSVLRRADGTLIATLERADITPLRAGGVNLPEPVKTLAADGVTPLYGVILRPSTFDPAKRYPVIDQIYPGPQVRRTPTTFMDAMFDRDFAQAVAELGFVVVMVDGRGTPGRSKAFLDLSYGKLSEAGFLEDHVATIRQLAESRPWMDLDRVGIYGLSGGANATTRAMLTYPDFFKVGVANAGNHDQRGYMSWWGETYNGPDTGQNYNGNAALAKNLKGKLLLMHGDLDANVSSALTLQVVDALIKANKDFDLLIVPNRGHSWDAYGTRVTWDYLVRNLMGATPPKEYQMPKATP